MHGINYSLIPRIEGVSPIASRDNNLGGMRNLLPLAEKNKFGKDDGQAKELRGLMRKLAARIGRERHWPDVLSGATDNADNPLIPSGYTYLLQLVAHDLVSTSISPAATQGRYFGFHNSRVQALTLDTIFGGGPDVCPHAYEYSEQCRLLPGLVPRTRLRIGRSRIAGGGTADQPFNDVGRAIPVDANDSGISPPKQIDRCPRTEALLADPRNDDHALISQLALLWHRFHNYLVDEIEKTLRNRVPAERAYHSFILSRFIVTLIYRKIVLYDVLGRLLHPVAFKHYVLDGNPLVTTIAGESGIPVEFAHGAFRCGHVMIRDSYRVNSNEEQRTDRALMQSSMRYPAFVPITDEWVVDWSRFFFPFNGSAATGLNFSRRLGPNFSGLTKGEMFFGPLVSDTDGSTDPAGLHSRDLVTSIFANMWSVPPLINELRARSTALSNLLPDYAQYQAPLTAWLEAAGEPVGGIQFAPGDAASIAENPPLPFFVLFEAALGDKSAASPFRGGGQHLGPLGSIIVAETILGAVKEFPLRTALGEFSPHEKFSGRPTSYLLQMGLDPKIAASIPEIRSMPELMAFMGDVGILPHAASRL
jgi:hypothetical protein